MFLMEITQHALCALHSLELLYPVYGTGILSVDIINQTFSFTGGFPLTDTGVTAMIGYYKYTGIGIDSCLF
jgi:hypothetical protein